MSHLYGSGAQMSLPYGSAGPQSVGNSRVSLGMGNMLVKPPGYHKKPRKRMNINAICTCLMAPCVFFAIVYWLVSFKLHYAMAWLCLGLVGLAFLGALAVAALAASKLRQLKLGDTSSEPTWYVFLGATLMLAVIAGAILGDLNFWHNLQPYYQIATLDEYVSVDPATTSGRGMMDAGRIRFMGSATVDVGKSMGFMNVDTYCVAPIVSPGQSGDHAVYDFWAVGLNCCGIQSPLDAVVRFNTQGERLSNQHEIKTNTGGTFGCGGVTNRLAHSGLRLIREDQRNFYRLAVQQAEAAYRIVAPHPLFFYWTEDPENLRASYWDDGVKYFFLGVFTFFTLQLALVTLAVAGFQKLHHG